MGIFNKHSIKLKVEAVEDNINYYVDYNKHKDPDFFVTRLLKGISPDEKYLSIVDTQMMYKSAKDPGNQMDKLIETLDRLKLEYKVLRVERNASMNLFGASINLNEKKKVKDIIIGIIIDADKVLLIKKMLNLYSVFYYAGSILSNSDEIFDIFEKCYHADTLNDHFDYNIFDNYFIKKIAIYAKKDKSEFIGSVIDDLSE